MGTGGEFGGGSVDGGCADAGPGRVMRPNTANARRVTDLLAMIHTSVRSEDMPIEIMHGMASSHFLKPGRRRNAVLMFPIFPFAPWPVLITNREATGAADKTWKKTHHSRQLEVRTDNPVKRG